MYRQGRPPNSLNLDGSRIVAGVNRGWRKPVGVEPTRDTEYRTTGLKPAPSTGQDWLPRGNSSKQLGVVRAAAPCQGDVAGRRPERYTEEQFFPPVPRSSNGRTAAFGAVNRGSNPCCEAGCRISPKPSFSTQQERKLGRVRERDSKEVGSQEMRILDPHGNGHQNVPKAAD